MQRMRIGAMAATIAVVVAAFLGAQRLELIAGPWSRARLGHGSFSTSAARYTAAIVANPSDYMTYYRRGTYFQDQQQLEDALADFDQAIRLSPQPQTLTALGPLAGDSSNPDTHTLGLVLLVHTARATTLQQMNRPEEALADLDRAFALDPRKTGVLYTRGMLKTLMGRLDDAISDFDFLLNTRSDPGWYFGRGLAKYLKADWNGAAQDFQQATRNRTPGGYSLLWLTKAQLRAGLAPHPMTDLDKQSRAAARIAAFTSDDDPVQHAANADASADQRQKEDCENALFMGDWLTIRKKGEGAHEMYTQALAACQPLSIEHAVAAAELSRVTADASAK